MKKRILCLVMGLVLTAGMSMTAFAEDYKDTNSWTADWVNWSKSWECR